MSEHALILTPGLNRSGLPSDEEVKPVRAFALSYAVALFLVAWQVINGSANLGEIANLPITRLSGS
ncbi:MAG: hypothetical protein ABW000_14430 [Actinoplanes sp.]